MADALHQSTAHQPEVYVGGFADAAHDSARAFRSIMNVMARPGTIEPIVGGMGPQPLSVAASTLILTLCDGNTGIYLAGDHDAEAIRGWITFHTGAPFVSAEEADFAVGTWSALQPIKRFKVGDASYPDRAATLIVEQPELAPTGVMLRGPGIKDSAALNLPEIDAFQRNRRQFPLGFDCLFASGEKVAALPRSTRVEEAA
ncbi:MAG: phosphonate C-P lyase system protein PhnH [Devosiaceae bacterium]|nr:phosphonate C-P lyase system protein PhnH [Devosiaceae bacterium MH13]